MDRLKDLLNIMGREKNLSHQKLNRERFVFFRFILLLVILAFLILTFYIKLHPFLNFDLSVTILVQSFQPPWFDQIMKFVSLVGNAWPGSILVLVVGVFLYFYWRLKKEAWLLVFSVLGSFLVGVFFKAIVARPRPDPSLIHQVGKYLKADSFPSGHVLFYMGFFGFLLFIIFAKMKKSFMRSFLIWAMLLLMFLIGLSRIYLGAHWFSDVLGAYLIGTIWLYLMVHLFQKLIR